MIKNKRSSTYWEEHLKTWEGSGKSLVEYSRENNLNYATLRAYKSKLSKTKTFFSKPNTSEGKFIPVNVSPSIWKILEFSINSEGKVFLHVNVKLPFIEKYLR